MPVHCEPGCDADCNCDCHTDAAAYGIAEYAFAHDKPDAYALAYTYQRTDSCYPYPGSNAGTLH